MDKLISPLPSINKCRTFIVIMSNDLGAFFVIGTFSRLNAAFISSIAGTEVRKRLIRDNKFVPMAIFHSYTSKVLQNKICLIEIFGIYDKKLCFSNSKLLCLLQYTYFQAVSKGYKPKGFIVTESKLENRSDIFGCLDKLFGICGSECKNSIVVLEKELSISKICKVTNPNIVSERCERLGVSCIKWRISLHKLTKESADRQISNLISALNNMQPYYATWMTELEEEIKMAPRVETTAERNIKEEIEDDEIDLDEMRNRLMSVSHLGSSMYFEFCRLTRRGVIKAARRAFGLTTSRVKSALIDLPLKHKRNH